MKNIKYLPIGLLSFMLLATIPAGANNSFDISEAKINEIESRLDQMSYKELIINRNNLIAERANLEATQDTTQSPSAKKAIGTRLKEISAELSSIQKQLQVLLVLQQFQRLVMMGMKIISHL